MKVKELIEELEKYDPELSVFYLNEYHIETEPRIPKVDIYTSTHPWNVSGLKQGEKYIRICN